MLDFSKNYFDLFGLPMAFEIPVEELSERYRELQRVVHPDRFANASDQERRLAVHGASLINEAFEVLRNPLSRARYLLFLRGIEADAASGTTTDSLFLMEQMELREALAEARAHADPYGVIASVLQRLNTQREALIAALAEQFADPTPEHLEAAGENVRKMQFVEKLRREAENLEAELDEDAA